LLKPSIMSISTPPNYLKRPEYSLKCVKTVGGWGEAPDPTGRAYSAPPDPLAELRGPLCGRGAATWQKEGRT
jgi:hypothetical protein